MSSYRTIKHLENQKRDLLRRTNFERIMIRLYNNCSRLNKKYRVKVELNKCVKCVRLDRKCDLTFFAIK